MTPSGSIARWTVVSLAAAVALGILSAPALAGPRSSTWAQTGFDSGRSHLNPNETTLDASNVAGLGISWVRDTGRAAPALASGLGVAGNGAFDPADGSDLFSLAVPSTDDSAPAITGGKIITASWGDPSLAAMDATTGDLIWEKPYADGASSPTVSRGTVFTTADGVLRAVDPVTGSVEWKRRISATDTGDPTVAGGRVFALVALGSRATSTVSHELVALDAATGRITWKRKVGYAISPYREWVVAAEGMVFTAKDNRLAALDPSNGSTLWRSEVGCCSHAPAVANGMVYTTEWTPEDDSILHALDTASGEAVWSRGGNDISSGVSVANGVVYQAAMGLEAFDATTGAELLDLDIGGTWHAPVVTGGTVYLAIENGPESPPETGEGLYAFRLP